MKIYKEPVKTGHEYFMGQALLEAKKAASKDEVPVGAVIVIDGRIIAGGHNLIISKNDPCGHAEIIAIRKAAKKRGSERLNGAILYATIEPCPMCGGAILLSRIKTLVYGAADIKTGACGSVHRVINDPRNNHQVEVVSGVLKDECGAIIKDFFKDKRKQKLK
ncbi:MAG: tRNA adenosine(34) deaminase TadA [Candidatus Goldiibacteriota bacterium]|jgi:tRNA(adenine34) deaminase